MRKEEIAKKLYEELESNYGNARCELNYTDAYSLLVAVVLSAQTTDKRVNIVTKDLFEAYPNMFEIEKADIKDVESLIKSIGLYKNKAKSIKELTHDIIHRFDGVVPSNKDDLMSLRGVGEKTANVVLGEFFKIPAIAVDTHIFRQSRRLALSKGDTPLKVQKDLEKLIPKENWAKFHKMFVLYGRYICKSRNPDCENCKLKEICRFYMNGRKD